MANFRKAIDAKCKECIYDPYYEGTWREQVENCTSYSCPLYPLRPVRIAQKTAKNEEIRDDKGAR